jgi:hypothetical protein
VNPQKRIIDYGHELTGHDKTSKGNIRKSAKMHCETVVFGFKTLPNNPDSTAGHIRPENYDRVEKQAKVSEFRRNLNENIVGKLRPIHQKILGVVPIKI